MKIVIFEAEDWEKPILEKNFQNHDLLFVSQPLDTRSAPNFSDADIISPFVHSNLHQDTLSQLPNLKCLATRSTGYDHIDTQYCAANNIAVSNVPNYGDHTVAEHAFALLLALSHHIPEATNRARSGHFHTEDLRGFDLFGKTIGIIGTGHIGLRAIEIARGFGMNIIASDLYPNHEAATNLGFKYVEFDVLLNEADIISLHIPGSEDGSPLLMADEFSKMKKGIVLINTARGSVIEIKALIGALNNGTVAAVGLDVLPEEPTIRDEAELLRALDSDTKKLETLLADHVLLHMKNVIVTPHNAYNTKEALQRILDTSIDNIKSFINQSPQNQV